MEEFLKEYERSMKVVDELRSRAETQRLIIQEPDIAPLGRAIASVRALDFENTARSIEANASMLKAMVTELTLALKQKGEEAA